jgi:hypothetical protein
MSLEDYEPVAVRLHRLLTQLRESGRATNSEPAVVTHLLSAPGADICVMRAELWIDGVLRATGHAEEVRGQGNVNRTSHLENCETSAIGRMCEAYNPTADAAKRPSREEMQKVARNKDGTDGGGFIRDTTPFSMTNKIPGKCNKCFGKVGKGEGIAIRNGDKWITAHRDGECPPDDSEEPF